MTEISDTREREARRKSGGQFAWQIDPAALPADWAGGIYIEADEETASAAAYPVADGDVPHMDKPLFTFHCPGGDTRLATIRQDNVVASALLNLRELAQSRGLRKLSIETCCGDELVVALAATKGRAS